MATRCQFQIGFAIQFHSTLHDHRIYPLFFGASQGTTAGPGMCVVLGLPHEILLRDGGGIWNTLGGWVLEDPLPPCEWVILKGMDQRQRHQKKLFSILLPSGPVGGQMSPRQPPHPPPPPLVNCTGNSPSPGQPTLQ